MNWRTSGSLRFGQLARRALRRRRGPATTSGTRSRRSRSTRATSCETTMRGRAGGVVERADQVGGDAHRDRVEAGERLVVHDAARGRARSRARARRGAPCRPRSRRCAGRRAPRRPTAFSFISTMSRIIVSSRSVCSRSGKATLSKTDRSVNSAPNWNSMPSRRRSANSCSRVARVDDLAVEADAALIGARGRRRSGAAASSCRSPSRRGSAVTLPRPKVSETSLRMVRLAS